MFFIPGYDSELNSAKEIILYSARAQDGPKEMKDTKQQPGTAGPGNMLGCCLISFHFLWTILSTSTVFVQFLVDKTAERLCGHLCKSRATS